MKTISEEAVGFDPRSAESLNRGCVCRPLDPVRLVRELEAEPSLAGMWDDIRQTRPVELVYNRLTVFFWKNLLTLRCARPTKPVHWW